MCFIGWLFGCSAGWLRRGQQLAQTCSVVLSCRMWNHSTVWVGRDFKDHQFQIPCCGMVASHQTRLPRALSSLALSTSGNGASTHSGSVPGLYCPLSEKFTLICLLWGPE